MVGLACGATSYLTATSAGRLTTEGLSWLIAAFLGAGATTSALTSSNPRWWRSYFSALGEKSDQASLGFNLTLVVTGLALTTLSGFLTADLTRWARHDGVAEWKVRVVRIAFGTLGIMVACVGLVPVDVSFTVHNTVAYGLVAAFAVLVLAVVVLLGGLSRSFRLTTYVALALLAAAVVLHVVVGYYNTTAFQMVSVTTMLAWLVLFVRAVAAAGVDHPVGPGPDEPQSESRALPHHAG